MSGIAGVWYLDGKAAEPSLLDSMLARIGHRGPDGVGAWCEGSVGLGHRMLWTTPQSLQEKLPLGARSGELVITADARIDNREELIHLLDLGGCSRDKIADSELILHAYERWGNKCPERLLGDFAFAIWDGRTRTMFCARDHMGVKPFYYYHSKGVFVFGSEIKALLCVPEVPRRLNEVRVGDYLAKMFDDKTITFYQEIWRLRPAHTITVSQEGLRYQGFWQPDLRHELRLGSDEEYAEAFRDVFTEAVRCRLRSAFPVGSMLSGGLDSSSIASVAQQALAANGDGRLHTFSAIFPSLKEKDPRIDERPYIDSVLETADFERHFVRTDRLSPIADLLWQDDEAIPAPNLYMDVALFEACQQEGVRVILSGFDGDSAVSYGYERLPHLLRTGAWRTLIRESDALAGKLNVPRRRIIRHLAVKPTVPKAALRLRRKLRKLGYYVEDEDTVIKPEFVRRIELAKRRQVIANNSAGWQDSPRKWHWYAVTDGLLLYALELLDKAAAISSVEARFPFFDRRLIELCIALPLEQKLRDGTSRAIVRRAMSGLLPEAVLTRVQKGNLGANFDAKLLNEERQVLEEVILEKPAIIERYIDIGGLRQAYHRFVTQPKEIEHESLDVFLVVVLARWLQRVGLSI